MPDDYKQKIVANNAAIVILNELVTEYPKEISYKESLARNFFGLGGAFSGLQDPVAAELPYRRATELYAQVMVENSHEYLLLERSLPSRWCSDKFRPAR